jgi:protein subunit release factor A
MTLYSLGQFMNGGLDEMIEALRIAEQATKLERF